MDELVLVSKKELAMLREQKINSLTLKDIQDLIDNRPAILKWLMQELRLYQVKLGNLEFVGKEGEATASIRCLINTMTRLEKIEEEVKKYYKKEEEKKKSAIDTA